jgi:hypothetical protein
LCLQISTFFKVFANPTRGLVHLELFCPLLQRSLAELMYQRFNALRGTCIGKTSCEALVLHFSASAATAHYGSNLHFLSNNYSVDQIWCGLSMMSQGKIPWIRGVFTAFEGSYKPQILLSTIQPILACGIIFHLFWLKKDSIIIGQNLEITVIVCC